MRIESRILALIAVALAVTPLTGFAKGKGGGGAQPGNRATVERSQGDINRDRLRDRDRLTTPSHDRDRIQDRTHAPDFAKLSDHDIYGNEVMNAKERNTYRKQLQNAASGEERAQIEARHRKEMQIRAENSGTRLAPPGKGIYGGATMSVEERNQYRQQLLLVDSDPKAKKRFMAEHQEKMQMRAKTQNSNIDQIGEIEEAE